MADVKQYGRKTSTGGTQLVRKGVSADDLRRMYQEEPDFEKGMALARAAGDKTAEEFVDKLDRKYPDQKMSKERYRQFPGAPKGYKEDVTEEDIIRGYAKGGLVKKTKSKPVMKMAKGGMMCSPRKKMAMGGMVKGCKRSGVK